MSHMSSNDDQPVDPQRVRYRCELKDDSGFEVECTDVREGDGFLRFMDGPVPAGLVPLTEFSCFYRLEPKK